MRTGPRPGPRPGLRGAALTVLGWLVTLTGVVLWPLPGPGLLLIFVGLAILAEQHEWAERRVDRVRVRAVHGAARGVETHPRALLSVLGTALLAASGVLWLWAPAQPAWWVLPAWTWLPGGLWAGVSQIASGLLTLGLVLWAYRRYHGRPEEIAALGATLHDPPPSGGAGRA